VDIHINETILNDNVVSVDGDGNMPCLVLQYDPPWDTKSVGDHYHFMPLNALADAQLIFGVPSDIEAVEFHILNHAADVQASAKNAAAFSTLRAEAGNNIQELVNVVGDLILEEARTMPLGKHEDMVKGILEVATEVGGGGLMAARGIAAASAAHARRNEIREATMRRARGNSINKSARGYSSLESILSSNSDRIEEARAHVMEAKYGRALKFVIAERLRTEGKGKI
jgi:hypothetical protein